MQNITPPKWVVKDICEEDSVVAIFGQPKSGKSFVTVDLACNIVLGHPTGMDMIQNRFGCLSSW